MFGTSMLCVEGQISSYFFPVKMSIPTMWTCVCKSTTVTWPNFTTVLQAQWKLLSISASLLIVFTLCVSLYWHACCYARPIHIHAGSVFMFQALLPFLSRHTSPDSPMEKQFYSNMMEYLGVAMFACLGGGHLHYFTGSSFQDHKTIFAQGRTLHGEGGGGPSITSCKIQISICHVGSVTYGTRKGGGCYYLLQSAYSCNKEGIWGEHALGLFMV